VAEEGAHAGFQTQLPKDKAWSTTKGRKQYHANAQTALEM